ncbi:MAG: ATP-binding protein [Burkholderiales bacterium]|nr:ATP-binding protein [Burkholderiales bacterium]
MLRDALPTDTRATWHRWLDALVERELLRLRARFVPTLEEWRTVYVTDAQIDALLDPAGEPGALDAERIATLTDEAAQLALSLAHDGLGAALAARLALDEAALALLLCALAPDLDPRYEAHYAYLNDDAARRLLTLDLARRLLGSDDVAALTAPGAALVALGLVELIEPPEPRSRWRRELRVAEPVLQFALGLPPADAAWQREAAWCGAPAATGPCAAEPLVHVAGDDAEDRREAAHAWAVARGLATLHVPAPVAAAHGRSLLLAARLAGAALLVDNDGVAPVPARSPEALAGLGVPLALLTPPALPAAAWLADWPHLRINAAPPAAPLRAALWQQALAQQGLAVGDTTLQALSLRHPLSATRIRAAATAAAWSRHADDDEATLAALLDDEARARAHEALGRVARRVDRQHAWDELVLNEVTLRQLRELADAIRVRDRVYGAWGLGRRSGRGAGLAALFCGASGTGKTMAASVVAAAAGQAVYRVDLAAVVSKYIGETEQNLDRVFRAAERSCAVLLFDEADALLGRRSEVKDAQDRYANLEVAYLLQKLEEHAGVVILASNLPKNLDSAFVRRMHFTIEFARPAAPLRERLWRGMLPPALPRSDDIDFTWLAERFDITGGEIQAATLDAAFYAAAADLPLDMSHLLHALSRRQAQQGQAVGTARYGR